MYVTKSWLRTEIQEKMRALKNFVLHKSPSKRWYRDIIHSLLRRADARGSAVIVSRIRRISLICSVNVFAETFRRKRNVVTLVAMATPPKPNRPQHLHKQTETGFRMDSETGLDKWNTAIVFSDSRFNSLRLHPEWYANCSLEWRCIVAYLGLMPTCWCWMIDCLLQCKLLFRILDKAGIKSN